MAYKPDWAKWKAEAVNGWEAKRWFTEGWLQSGASMDRLDEYFKIISQPTLRPPITGKEAASGEKEDDDESALH